MNTAPPRYRSISLLEFAATFIPFGVLLVLALLAPERTDAVTLYRVKYTIWLSTALLIPGLCLYALPHWSSRQANFGLLLITFSYLAYMVHFYLAGIVMFGGV